MTRPRAGGQYLTLRQIDEALLRVRRFVTEYHALRRLEAGAFIRRADELNEARRGLADDLLPSDTPIWNTVALHHLLLPTPGGELPDEDVRDYIADGVAALETLDNYLEARRADTRLAILQDLFPDAAYASSLRLYRDGHYRNSILDAALTLINAVKVKSGRSDLDGVALMNTVFSRKSPILAANELRDRTEEDEQEGIMHFFVGLVQTLRNPRAHAAVQDSAEASFHDLVVVAGFANRLGRMAPRGPVEGPR